MLSVYARKALLSDGWSRDVRITVHSGTIVAIQTGVLQAEGDVIVGTVIPGLINAHSHAFQRALVGRTEERSPEGKDNFWTWRSRMYALAQRIDAEALTAIARELYCEMVAAGYVGVCEFHYLLNEPGDTPPGDKMLRALAVAAADSGIRLTYIPVLYQRAGFDQPELDEHQKRFAMPIEAFESHYKRARDSASGYTVGVGVHSLRAVPGHSLERVVRLTEEDGVPVHLHIAEQQREIDQCLAALGDRPVRWLLREHDVDERWCLVHATHLADDEVEALAASGAVVCLCPSTEGNLGDGIFPLQKYLDNGGRIAIGSDSHVTINPFEELRWLEYGQRLVAQCRNVAMHGREVHTGRSLFELAARGGARAGGGGVKGLTSGAPADLVVLDDDGPMLAGHGTETLLDALVFSGFTLPIDRVMVQGAWQVSDGRHCASQQAREDYARTIHRLFPDAGRT